jgi:hypothetical protein
MLNYMFRPKTVNIKFTKILSKLLQFFYANNSCYVPYVFYFLMVNSA